MVLEIIITALSAGAVTFFATKKLDSLKYQIFVEQAKSKAKAIEHEAQLLLESSKSKTKNLELEARRKLDAELFRLTQEFENKQASLNRKEEFLNTKNEEELQAIAEEKRLAKKLNGKLQEQLTALERQKQSYDAKLNESIKIIESAAGMTANEAKDILLQRVEEESRANIAHIVRKYETEAKTEARKRANYIIAQATTRFAGEFAAERLINVIHIAGEEIKGRIIGKEGRNIKVMEMLLGVDIIVDDTPGAIIISSFNLYRRAIATKTIELLLEDGRIQPTRIEEIYEKVKREFDDRVQEEGENIVLDLGIGKMHPELVKLIGKLRFRASYGQNALGHSLEVVHLAGIIAAELGGDEVLARRAAILHDIGKALTHEYQGSHVDLGAEICKRYKEHPVVINAIFAHHGLEEIKSIECAAVCTADALSAARPGARREVLESFLKRVEEIEQIATSKHGVKNAFAIGSGREIRVIANANLLNDDEATLLSKEIAREIEQKVQYPGEIRVSVIRELRAVDFAR